MFDSNRHGLELEAAEVTGQAGSPHSFGLIRIAVTAAPAIFFSLIGLITRGLDEPGAKVSPALMVALLLLQSLGIVAIALAALMNFGIAQQRLARLNSGVVPAWRQSLLWIALSMLVLFYVLANLGAAFAGADMFLIAACPAFLGYVAMERLAFHRLPTHPHHARGWSSAGSER